MTEKIKKHNISRRNFVRTTGLVAGAAGLGLQPAMHTLTTDLTPKAYASGGEETKRVGCCWTCVYCQYNAVVRDGNIVKTEPIEGGSERGSRMCLRGRSRFRMPYSATRIKYPMKRAGERGEDNWERISWDEAISTITEKWKTYQDKFGKNSIGYYWGSGNCAALGSGNYNGLFGRLANVLEFTYIDYCTDMALGYGSSRALGSGAKQNESQDILNADKVFLWGSSYVESWWQLWWPLADAMENGTKLFTIDPSYSTTASKSDVWISNRPGSDPLVILSVMQHIVSQNLHNVDFLLNHTTAAFLVRSDTKMLLRMSHLGVEPTEGPVNASTGEPTIIDPPVVWDNASKGGVSYENAVDPAISSSFSVEGIDVRTSFDYLVDELNKYPPEEASKTAQISVEEIELIAREQCSGNIYNIPGYASQAYANGAEFGHALAILALLTGSLGRPGASVGATWWSYPTNTAFLAPSGTGANQIPVLGMPEIMKTGKLKGEDYPIKSLFIAAGNPMSSSASTSDILEWWNKIEFIVVADLQFTDSVRYADIVLPSTHALENEDILVGSYYPYIGVTEKAAEAPFETKADSEMARLIANEMGVGEYFDKSNDDYLREIVDESLLSKALGITVDRIREEKDICYDNSGIRFEGCIFPTETGRANIYLETVAPRIDWGQELDPDVGHVPTFFPPHEAWSDNDIMKKYPLVLNSERLKTRWHTGEFNNEWMLEVSPEPILKINPVDAEARGIKDGDYVEVFNDRGHAVVKAVLANDRQPGVLIYPKGWQLSQFVSGSWSELTSCYPDPFAVNTSFMDVVAEVRLWEKEG